MRGGDGSEVIYALRNNDTLANSILDELAKAGQNIRGAYQRKSTVNPNKDYYFMQRNTGDTESITIEYGFLDSTKDDVSQIKNNWQKYAEAAVQGILNYIKGGTIEEGIYIVKQGDSLYSIANKYNTTVNDIKRLNNLSSNELSIGQRLKIPVISNNDNYYLVKKGDTLYSIARNNNITVLELKRLNNLTSNEIYEGQKLILKPNSNNDVDTYTVQVGDTLYSIAKKYGISVDELKKANNITNNLLSIDQKLIIPKTERIYIVQNGDTLYKIANQNNTTVQKIKELNNLTNDLLMVGQELFL